VESIDRIKEVMIKLKHELGVHKACFQSKLAQHNASDLSALHISHGKLLTNTNG
jgi:hypothetical protein